MKGQDRTLAWTLVVAAVGIGILLAVPGLAVVLSPELRA